MEIFDAYVENLTEQAKAKEKKTPKPGGGGTGREDKRSTSSELQVGTPPPRSILCLGCLCSVWDGSGMASLASTLIIVCQASEAMQVLIWAHPLTQSDDITKVAKSAKIMERMVNQNIFDEISQGETN